MLNGDLDLDGHGGGAAESSGSPHDVCPDARRLASHGRPLLASAPPPSRLTPFVARSRLVRSPSDD